MNNDQIIIVWWLFINQMDSVLVSCPKLYEDN